MTDIIKMGKRKTLTTVIGNTKRKNEREKNTAG